MIGHYRALVKLQPDLLPGDCKYWVSTCAFFDTLDSPIRPRHGQQLGGAVTGCAEREEAPDRDSVQM
jgi:hypothetical protein